ncbi:SMI1/KNR4 family protein [Sphingomonas sp. BT-65]|uniref:SMI1/KNR4 family protein n=1 Tax=Sphingomonas sp. BT-65 TaxID=2989821 RepID=UPI0022360655|nr:SMI1/KNR4 family protein [Sphingomonas sp. BT-65]MCW4463569.1 SMI1/KNR4 family protein [Sphingomonas sp. BT-65]
MLEGRDWFAMGGAPAEELSYLRAVAPHDLPERYLDLLAFSNGGEGPLPSRPHNMCLDPAGTVAVTIESANHGQADLQGFLVFGSNGGGEYIAFDTRTGTPWPVVTIDMVAGGGSAEVIAPDFDAFYDRIGIEEEAATGS